jgi:hypothetical protein
MDQSKIAGANFLKIFLWMTIRENAQYEKSVMYSTGSSSANCALVYPGSINGLTDRLLVHVEICFLKPVMHLHLSDEIDFAKSFNAAARTSGHYSSSCYIVYR